MLTLRSPVPWVGGKHYMAGVIVETFPPSTAYDVYREPFMGGCHVIARKPPFHHYEIINDINGDLVNFWLQLRDHAQDIAARLSTLPYSRKLHYDYYRSLFDRTDLDEMERAVRWFYVLQSSFSAWISSSSSVGWKSGPRTPVGSGATMRGQPHVLQSTLALFAAMQKRFRTVEIDNRDFAAVIERHQGLRTLFYVDPPYLGVEDYYRQVDGVRFDLADHERLAALLNATASLVVLSSYEPPQLSEWYPETKWRRVRWQTVKHSQRTKATRERVTEVLLCNYPASKHMACVQTALFEQEAVGEHV
ncbi:MAG: DNA adenine methylase [Ktedonobacteraceae bacterium]|nr:DNA adenine methylase [Ktedonobacteraceae bacterium]